MEISLRKAESSDADMLLEWSNDSVARQNSFNKERIKKSNHYKWFDKKLNDPNSLIFIFNRTEKPIGIVRFDIADEVVIGVNVAPSERGKGVGSNLIRMGCEEFWKDKESDVFAYIKQSNIASIKSFEKVGFFKVKLTEYMGIKCVLLKASKL